MLDLIKYYSIKIADLRNKWQKQQHLLVEQREKLNIYINLQIFFKKEKKNIYQGRMISLFQRFFLSYSLSWNLNEKHCLLS